MAPPTPGRGAREGPCLRWRMSLLGGISAYGLHAGGSAAVALSPGVNLAKLFRVRVDHQPSRARRRSRRGFTLIEIGIVLSIVAILAVLGVATMRGSMPRYRMVNASKELKGDLGTLRMHAIEQNRQTRLVLLASDPSYLDPELPSVGAWQLQVGNRSRNSTRWSAIGPKSDVDLSKGGSRPAPDVSLMPWGSLIGPGTNSADAIVFSPRGWVENPPEDFQAEGYIVLTLVNKEARARGINDFIEVRVARSGLVDLKASLGRDPDGGSVGTAATSSGAFFGGTP